MTKRAVIYLRQSREDNMGIDRQRERSSVIVQARDWDLIGEYVDDDVSATKARGAGTAWGQMLADAKAGRFDIIVAVDLDRLLRSIGDLVTLTETGVAVLTVDGEIDLTTADGEFRATMLAGIARFEVRRKAERQIRAAEQRAAKGIPHKTHRSFGYEPDAVTLRESEAQIVRDLFRRILAGESLRSLTRGLNADQIPTARGKSWTPAQTRQLLLRERNAGLLVRHGVIQPVSLIEPIVSIEDWEAVVGVLTDGSRSNNKGRAAERYWLSGILTCQCGSFMGSKPVRSKGHIYPTYVCYEAVKGPGKGHVAIAVSTAEPTVREAVMRSLLFNQGTQAPESKEVKRLTRKIRTAEAERAAAMELYVIEGADKKHALALIQAASARLEALVIERNRALGSHAGASLMEALPSLYAATKLAGVRSHPANTATAKGQAEARALRAEARAEEAKWNDAFDALDIDAKRLLVRALVKASVMPAKGNGYGAQRIEIEYI